MDIKNITSIINNTKRRMSKKIFQHDNIKIIHEDDWPDGLFLYKNFIPKEYQKKLYDYIDDRAYLSTSGLKREVQHYGFVYDYNIHEPNLKKLDIAESAPTVLECIARTIYDTKIMKCYPNQIIVNKYVSGQGISPHRDHYPIFDTDVGSLSLGSKYIMVFKHHKSHPDYDPNVKLELALPVGSLLIFADEARMNWTHEIQKKKSDKIDGKRILRGTRISVTFRTVVEKCRGKICKIVDENMDKLNENRFIEFYDGDKNDFKEFSNFYVPDKLIIKDFDTNEKISWQTTEHYYQAMKYTDPEYRRIISTTNTPNKAFALGRRKISGYASAWKHSEKNQTKIGDIVKQYDVYIRNDWDDIKDFVMHRAVRSKFIQNKNLSKMLLDTDNSIIVENTPRDSYWANGGKTGNGIPESRGGTMSGENRLGEILMLVRDELTMNITNLSGISQQTNWLIPNRFLVGAYPIDWLDDIIDHIDIIISLIEENDVENYQEYRDKIKNTNLTLIEYPIKDRKILADNDAIKIADEIQKLLFKGYRIYLHCVGGKGRTGTIAGIVLGRLLDMNYDDTVEFLARSFNSRADKGKKCLKMPQTVSQFKQIKRVLENN